MAAPSGLRRPSSPTRGFVALGLLIAGAALLVCLWGSGQTIVGDEWRYADGLASSRLRDAIFEPAPSGRYVIPVALVVYDGLFRVFGIDSYIPYRLADLAVLGTVAALLFLLVRRRAGDLAGLAAAALILTLGPAAGAIAVSTRLPGLLALAAGLGALLALDRRPRGGDAVACGLLVAAAACHPQSVAFIAAAAVMVLLRPGSERLQRLWVFLVPAAAALALLRAGRMPAGASLGERLADAPGFAFDGLTGTVAALTGLHNPFWAESGAWTSPAARALAIAVIALVVWRLARARPLPPLLAAASVCLIVLLTSPALAPSPEGTPNPNQARYLLPAAVVLLVALAECAGTLPSIRFRAQLGAIAGAALAFALCSNLVELHREQRDFVIDANHIRAELRALEVGRGSIPPGLEPDRIAKPPHGFPLSAARYYAIAARFGTPAFTEAELRRRSQHVKQTFARVLSAP